MSEDDVVRQFLRLPELVKRNPALVRRGAFLSDVFLVGVGDRSVYVTVRQGEIGEVDAEPSLMRPWTFAIRANADAWSRFWEPVPAPGYNDLLAMARFGKARIEGELRPLMANLRYIKEVLEAPRHAPSEAAAPEEMKTEAGG